MRTTLAHVAPLLAGRAASTTRANGLTRCCARRASSPIRPQTRPVKERIGPLTGEVLKR